MSKSRLGPEARIITLFAALSEDSKRIVLDVIKSQSTTPRKAAAKKSSASPLAQKEPTATPGTLCAFIYPDKSACNCAEGNPIHQPEGGYAGYHPFTKSVARAPRKSKPKSEETSSIPSLETSSEDVGNAALAASGGG
jgi:hypothetical protein